MDAIEFVKQLRRMDEKRVLKNCFIYPCVGRETDLPEDVVAEVEQWAKEHPIKTRQSELLKMFPNSKRGEDGTLLACPEIFEPGIKNECDGNCHRCKFKRGYWLQEVE